ncbi:MAG: class II aldolase/adducin family protein [Trichlorobacter sp.]|uniref:class II aldolase/adducin family protein n=1 Tax=Trichlorobacter sp. TaxID=2911007 RepID=UPI002561844D|nr:class II aldolase/adducin family protein [Trichlorobacter sp.]MDK9719211.1 class II aldolase/adducin family protein [Trichlorobacter sp.]
MLAEQILQRLDCAAIIIAEPLHPFPSFLLRRAAPDTGCIVPRDSESRSSLHDIPLIRKTQDQSLLLDVICETLSKRKGCIVEGLGIISQGTLTVEQAYIAWSSLLHATTVKYFEDLLTVGTLLPEESEALAHYKNNYLKPLTFNKQAFCSTTPSTYQDVIEEMSLTGQSTIELGLVDSFFGNISCFANNMLYISQTSARLDQLCTQIDTVPFDGSSTAGMTASSELPAHRAIILATNCKAILHGHPRFPVIMSFFANSDTVKAFDLLGSLPVVSGEGGVGGLAESLPKAFSFSDAKAVIVQGHGVFVISHTGFGEALSMLAEVELLCRDLYFERLYKRHQI